VIITYMERAIALIACSYFNLCAAEISRLVAVSPGISGLLQRTRMWNSR
jgi:hypothetical protein